MSIAETFFAYAQAFEKTVVDDDWSRLEAFFAADAEYLPGDGQAFRGRDAVFAHLKESLDTFDRLFDQRRPELVSQPEVTDDTVVIHWKATYRKEGLPEISIEGREEATFAKNLIVKLEDTLNAEATEIFQSWTEAHGAELAKT